MNARGEELLRPCSQKSMNHGPKALVLVAEPPVRAKGLSARPRRVVQDRLGESLFVRSAVTNISAGTEDRPAQRTLPKTSDPSHLVSITVSQVDSTLGYRGPAESEVRLAS
jgi:hypothetical protein